MVHIDTHTEPLLFVQAPYDWEVLLREFDWLRAMQRCPQDSVYHAEGDVFTHTRLVVEALLALPAYQSLPADTKSLLMAACLLHDIGKPATTILESDGRISSRGHAKLGERMVRQLLANVRYPYAFREQLCKLVCHHGLPLWILEKFNPQKAAIAASLTVNTEWLALVAEADVRGRICADQQELLYRIDLFREFCRESQCYGQPYEFSSEHSRFVYFRKEEAYPAYEAFDDTRFTVYMMVGLPGSGKDTWILSHLRDLPVVSLDAIRKRMKIEPTDNQGAVMQAAKEQARIYMRRREPFVWNATNVVRQTRQQLIDLFADYGGRIVIVYQDKPLEVVLSQNRNRQRMVPEPIISRFFEKLEPPDLTEAHQVLIVSE